MISGREVHCRLVTREVVCENCMDYCMTMHWLIYNVQMYMYMSSGIVALSL